MTRPEPLSRSAVDADPLLTVATWFDDATAAGLGAEPVATLATVDADGAPDARAVVVRSWEGGMPTIYSDTRSAKGRHLARDCRASLVVVWPELGRQLRLRGEMTVAPAAESDAAFAGRERRSQVGYWSNEQSAPVADRAALEARLDATAARFAHEPLVRPEHWVVYRLVPTTVELWQSGARHLHDRFACVRASDGSWEVTRLQP